MDDRSVLAMDPTSAGCGSSPQGVSSERMSLEIVWVQRAQVSSELMCVWASSDPRSKKSSELVRGAGSGDECDGDLGGGRHPSVFKDGPSENPSHRLNRHGRERGGPNQ